LRRGSKGSHKSRFGESKDWKRREPKERVKSKEWIIGRESGKKGGRDTREIKEGPIFFFLLLFRQP